MSSSEVGVAFGRGSRLLPGAVVTMSPSAHLRGVSGDTNDGGIVGARLRVVPPIHPATPRATLVATATGTVLKVCSYIVLVSYVSLGKTGYYLPLSSFQSSKCW